MPAKKTAAGLLWKQALRHRCHTSYLDAHLNEDARHAVEIVSLGLLGLVVMVMVVLKIETKKIVKTHSDHFCGRKRRISYQARYLGIGHATRLHNEVRNEGTHPQDRDSRAKTQNTHVPTSCQARPSLGTSQRSHRAWTSQSPAEATSPHRPGKPPAGASSGAVKRK